MGWISIAQDRKGRELVNYSKGSNATKGGNGIINADYGSDQYTVINAVRAGRVFSVYCKVSPHVTPKTVNKYKKNYCQIPSTSFMILSI
jgi:hypothetical protein